MNGVMCPACRYMYQEKQEDQEPEEEEEKETTNEAN